jgi:hypothetical protein
VRAGGRASATTLRTRKSCSAQRSTAPAPPAAVHAQVRGRKVDHRIHELLQTPAPPQRDKSREARKVRAVRPPRNAGTALSSKRKRVNGTLQLATINKLFALARCGLDQSTANRKRLHISYVGNGCLNSIRRVICPGSHDDLRQNQTAGPLWRVSHRITGDRRLGSSHNAG